MLGPSLLVAPVIAAGWKGALLPARREAGMTSGTRNGWKARGSSSVKCRWTTIPVFGREGTILPLGPEVQHTGELRPGTDLNEIWTFGQPQTGFELPGIRLEISGDGEIQNTRRRHADPVLN